MLRFSISLLLLLASSAFLQGQDKYDNTWLFGRYDPNQSPQSQYGGSRLDFSTYPPEGSYFDMPVGFDFSEISMVCDSAGNLQFYTDGCSLINYENQLIEHGDSLNPGEVYDEYCGNGYGYPTSQSSMILPLPLSDHIYYLFHIGLNEDQSHEFFRYTVVDMAQNNGLGKVLLKNQLLFDTLKFGQQMTAVRHANGRDWWLVLPHVAIYFDGELSNRYFKFLFSPSGITGPFRQDIGDGWGARYYSGQATFSPDGSKYVRLNPTEGMRIFDFDRCTGEFSNPRAIYFPNDTLDACGVSFSPNSRYLYASLGFSIVQYDTWASNIEASRVTVAVYDGFMSPLWTKFYQHMLAPDGRIYITVPGSANVLHVINHPNWQGLACDVQQHGLVLPTIHDWNIPNFPHFRLYDVPGSICDTLGIDTPTQEEVAQASRARLWPNPASEELNIAFSAISGNPVRFRLFDATGRLAREWKLEGSIGEQQLNLHGLADGLYFWKLNSAEGRALGRGKLVIVK